MRYWLNAGFVELDQLVPIARAAEANGFDGIALPDHLVHPAALSSRYPYSGTGETTWDPDSVWPDVWIAIAAMAQATEHLQFSTGVHIAPLRDPFSLAKAIGTVAILSGHRLLCGFGTGWMKEEFDLLGVDFASRGSRLDEMLEVMGLLWTGDECEFHGRHFDFAPLRMCPGPGAVPILIGGNTAPALRRAARHDGWIGSYSSVDETAAMVAALRSLREAAGRFQEPFRIVLTGGGRFGSDAAALGKLGVDTLTVPVRALARGASLGERTAGIERFAASVGA